MARSESTISVLVLSVSVRGDSVGWSPLRNDSSKLTAQSSKHGFNLKGPRLVLGPSLTEADSRPDYPVLIDCADGTHLSIRCHAYSRSFASLLSDEGNITKQFNKLCASTSTNPTNGFSPKFTRKKKISFNECFLIAVLVSPAPIQIVFVILTISAQRKTKTKTQTAIPNSTLPHI